MNHIYRSIWNDKTGTFVAVPENAKSAGKKSSIGATATKVGCVSFALKLLAISLMLTFGANSYALPVGGVVSAGGASISSVAGNTTVTQSTTNAAINWQSFNIAKGEAVQFVQPNSNSVALNRVLGADPSSILGNLSANGKVFLVNPNGILFGLGAQVNVGGLVASTLSITDSDFMAGRYNFAGNGGGTVLNQGSINADGGYVALLGADVGNNGVISAKLGTVALAAGNAITLDVAGDGLLNVTVNQGAMNALVQNGGLIQADGGQVLLTAQAAGTLLQGAVNNTGVIQAQTIENRNGTIRLLGDMQSGTVNVGGTLDASASNGGDGGFIETSAAHVKVADNTKITTAAPQGKAGTWLIDPVDFTISATATGIITGGTPSGDISGSTLSTALGSSSVTILSSQGSTVAGNGDINVNDAVSWSANTLLTLTAVNNINVNAVVTASGTSSLVMNTATTNGADGLVAGGAVKVGMNASGFTGRVDFFQVNGVTPRAGTGFLTINGLAYTVINSLGAPTTTTVTDLQGMKSGLAGNYALGTNIDACATGGCGIPANAWNAGAGFVPIGTPGTPFTGTFDGLGHTITALTINSGATSAGLFGATGSNLSFKNVGLVGGSVIGAAGSGGLIGTNGTGSTVSNSYNTGSVTGAAGTGGLVGDNTTGAVSNSYATGNVTGASGTGGLMGTNTTGVISNSYATGIVIGSNAGTGGLVGSNTTGAVSKSFALGSVTGTGAATGGLLGSTGANTVSDAYATGNVSGGGVGVGGLIGTSIGTVTTSYATGSVSGAGTGSQLGALVGGVAGTVTTSFWNSDTSLIATSVGGGRGMTTAEMKTQANFTSATTANGSVNPVWGFPSTWVMYDGHTYPLLRSFMTSLTVTANNDNTKTYNRVAYSGGNGVTPTPSGNLLGTVSYSGTSQGAINAGSYVITPGGLYSNQQGYIISYASSTLTISQLALNAAIAAVNTTYGTPAATGAVSFTNNIALDDVTSTASIVSPSNSSSSNLKAGSYKQTAGALGGVDSANYSFVGGFTTATNNYTVAQLALIGSITAVDKVYDTTTAAVITGRALAGILGTDVVTYTGGTATFDNPAVGTGKTVTGTGLGLSGADAGNYTVNPIAATTANITPVAPVVPPVVIPPVVVPPIEPPPVVVPAASLSVVPSGVPVEVLIRTPAQLLSVAPLPPVIALPITARVQPPPFVDVNKLPPTAAGPHPRPRKQDRNCGRRGGAGFDCKRRHHGQLRTIRRR